MLLRQIWFILTILIVFRMREKMSFLTGETKPGGEASYVIGGGKKWC